MWRKELKHSEFNLSAYTSQVLYQDIFKLLDCRLVSDTLYNTEYESWWKMWTWYLILTLADDLQLGTKEEVLPLKEYNYMRNMRALSVTIQVMAKVKFLQTERATDRYGKH